jgi:hypothetical protein
MYNKLPQLLCSHRLFLMDGFWIFNLMAVWFHPTILVQQRALVWTDAIKISSPSRELLVKTILAPTSIHFLTIFKMSNWTIAGVDKFRRSLSW